MRKSPTPCLWLSLLSITILTSTLVQAQSLAELDAKLREVLQRAMAQNGNVEQAFQPLAESTEPVTRESVKTPTKKDDPAPKAIPYTGPKPLPRITPTASTKARIPSLSRTNSTTTPRPKLNSSATPLKQRCPCPISRATRITKKQHQYHDNRIGKSKGYPRYCRLISCRTGESRRW